MEGRGISEGEDEQKESSETTTADVDALLALSPNVQQTDDQSREDVENVEEDEGESITPAQLVADLTLAWSNEICAPRLLPHKEMLVDLMVDQLEAMEDNFTKCKDQTALKVILHKMEVQRLAYITSEYIRERLKKIEKDVEVLLNEDEERQKTGAAGLLGATEKGFAERYEKMRRHLMDTCFLERIPPALQRLPTAAQDMSTERVIIETTSDKQEQATFPDMTDLLSDVSIELQPGSVHLMPYPSTVDLLEANKVRLL